MTWIPAMFPVFPWMAAGDMMESDMGGIGFTEILLILVVAILVYGKDLPRVARKAARAYAQVRSYISNMRDEISRQIPDEDLDLEREAAPTVARNDRPPEPKEAGPAPAFDPTDAVRSEEPSGESNPTPPA